VRALLGDAAPAVEAAWARARDESWASRLAAGDPSLYGEHAEGAAPWLGWTRVTEEMRGHVEDVEALVRAAAREGVRHALVLGMGGSSLCPEVTRCTYGAPSGIELRVLDSTDPEAVRRAGDGVDPARALFLVASKSGTTVEPLAFMAHFLARAEEQLGARDAAARFVAITDPGTPLAAEARERGFRAVFENPADIGGRYSALSLFGLLPMAIAGIPPGPVLDRAEAARQGDAGARLGVALATLGRAGRDKVTLLVDPPLEAFGLWVEQLVAESLGKEGQGLVPVAQEPLGEPGEYGDDRVFVYHRMTGERDLDCEAIAGAGHPVLVLEVRDQLDLAALYMTWELATAAAGAVLGVNPFDQPDVQAAKDATVRVLGQMERGEAPEDVRGGHEEAARLMLAARPGDYVSVLGFLPPSGAADRAAADIRRSVRARTGAATTFGYGPRFLHSTGQLHKGGPASGLFVQAVSDDAHDLPVPGRPYTFGQLKHAQALGDAQALADRGRRLVRIGVGADAAQGLRGLVRHLWGQQNG